MRWFVSALCLCLPSACASRSTLHAHRAEVGDDVDASVDTGPETWAHEVGPAPVACADRPATCPVDDWGPLRAVQAVYEECSAATGSACGDLRLVFDTEGCLSAIDEITTYSPTFVDCVERAASAKRWTCANGGGRAYHMFQSCSM